MASVAVFKNGSTPKALHKGSKGTSAGGGAEGIARSAGKSAKKAVAAG